MPKLPRVTAKDIIKILVKRNFILVRQKGSHRIFRSPDGKRIVTPFHDNKILHPKLIKDMQKVLNKEK